MDLSSLSTKQLSEEGAVMTVTDPRTGDPLIDTDGTSVTITLSGVDGQKYRDFQRKLQNRRLKQIGRGPKPKLEFDAGEMEKEGLELLANCTMGWSGIEWKGQVLPFSVENAILIYSELPWLKDQVDVFIGDRQNFFQKPATSSSSTSAGR